MPTARKPKTKTTGPAPGAGNGESAVTTAAGEWWNLEAGNPIAAVENAGSTETEAAGEWWALGDLKDHPRNYQEHGDDQIEHLAASLEENGFYRRVLIARDGTILAGHGIAKAARKIGWRKVPCRRFDLDPMDPRALKILAGDNEISRLGKKNDRLLANLLKDVQELAPGGLRGTGYVEQEVNQLLEVLAGEAAALTLDTMAAESETDGEDEAPPSTMMGMRTFVVVLTEAQDEKVREAIKKCKEENGLETTPAGLVEICQQYLTKR